MAQILAGAFLFVTSYFTWRTVRATERNIQIAEDKQITDRFSNATESLGSDKLPVCLGGIYTLERIARDSSDDCGAVIEVLSAFVREKRQLPRRGSEPNADPEFNPVTTDIQAAITVLGRINVFRPDHIRIETPRTDLRHVDFYGGNFAGANLTRSLLDHADFMSADLSGAVLIGARLDSADVTGTNFNGAALYIIDFTNVDFSDSDIENAQFDARNDPRIGTNDPSY